MDSQVLETVINEITEQVNGLLQDSHVQLQRALKDALLDAGDSTPTLKLSMSASLEWNASDVIVSTTVGWSRKHKVESEPKSVPIQPGLFDDKSTTTEGE